MINKRMVYAMKKPSNYLKMNMTVTHAYGAVIKGFVIVNTDTKKSRAILYGWLDLTVESDFEYFLKNIIFIPGFVINENIDLKSKYNEEDKEQESSWENYKYCTYVNRDKYPSLVRLLDAASPNLRSFYFINLVAFLFYKVIFPIKNRYIYPVTR